MRTTHPSDKIGSLMMLMLPQWIVHRVDPWSPFWPFANTCEEGQDASNSFNPPCAPQRTMDSDVSSRGYRSDYRPREPTQEELVNFMRSSNIEVVCVLEGTDSTTGKLVQVPRRCFCVFPRGAL
jgi:potassium inwardly-rectifying channel subfamily J